MKKRPLMLVLLSICLIMIFTTACSYVSDGTHNSDVKMEPQPDPIYHPLTGLEVDAEVTGRMLVISIDNNYNARPQSGVSQADLIYEVPAEGGIPRIIMCFYGARDEAAKIGPVRSARPYIVDVARGWDALFAHCGWSPEAQQYLTSGVVDYVNEIAASEYFWRDSNRYAPHNLYTSTEYLYSRLDDKEQSTEQDITFLPFLNNGEISAGSPAEWLEIKYPYADNIYVYNTENNNYARFIGENPYIDAETGEQVYVSNIIVQRVKSTVLDNAGRLKIDMCAGGEAILFTGGRMLSGSWSRDSLDSTTKFVDESGEEFKLNRGVTWIQICDGNVQLNYPQPEEETSDTEAAK